MRKKNLGHISAKQAMEIINREKVLLIDVKSKEEYYKSHLKGSINIPIEKFKMLIPRVAKNKAQKIIVYCSSGMRSLAAYEMLRDMGFYNVYNIYGGIKM